MDLTKDFKKKKVVDVVSSIFATSGPLKEVVIQCHIDKTKSKHKSDISKNLPATVSPEEQEQPAMNSKKSKLVSKIVKKRNTGVSAVKKPVNQELNQSKKVAEPKLPLTNYKVTDNIFNDQRKPYISSKYFDDAVQNSCHYNTPRDSLSNIFKKNNGIIYDKNKYMDNTQNMHNSTKFSAQAEVNNIMREIETWEHSMLREKYLPEIPQWEDWTNDNDAINSSKSQSSTSSQCSISIKNFAPAPENNREGNIGTLNVAEIIETQRSTPRRDMGNVLHDGRFFPKHADGVASPPDAALEHAEHLLLATRLQLSQLSNCLNYAETAILTHDRNKKLDSVKETENINADKEDLNCSVTQKNKELDSEPQNVHHKNRRSRNHMPGCRYHKDTIHNQKQTDQQQKHKKDLVSQITSKSHLEWQFLPSVNIKQSFQIQQGPAVSVPTASHKPFKHSNSNVQVIETVHNSFEDNRNNKIKPVSSTSVTNNSPCVSMKLTLDSTINGLDSNRRNDDKTNVDTKFQNSKTELSLSGNKISQISRNELNSNKAESKRKLQSNVSKTVHSVTLSTDNSQFNNETSQKVHYNTYLNNETHIVTKEKVVQHKKKTGGSKTILRQKAKLHRRKPFVCRPSNQQMPKISPHQTISQNNNLLHHHSLLKSSTSSKNSGFESGDALSKSSDEPSKIKPSSSSNVGYKKDGLICSTPQDSINIHANSEIQQTNQVSQPHLLNLLDIQNQWHTQLNTTDTSTTAVDNSVAKMHQLESAVFNAISSEVLSGLLHNVECTSSEKSRKRFDLEVDKTVSMIKKLQSKYEPNECSSEDRSINKNNDGDQSYDDDFEDEDRQNEDINKVMEGSEILSRIESSPSDNDKTTLRNENYELENINYSIVEKKPELNQTSPSLSPKQISNCSLTLRSPSPLSLSKELEAQDMPEVTARIQISTEDLNHSCKQSLEPNSIKSPVPTLAEESSLHAKSASSSSFNYFPVDFYKSLQPKISVKETVSQKLVSKESPENTINVSSLISDSSTTSQTNINFSESLSSGEIGPKIYSFPSLLNFQKMDLNLTESLSCGEINPKVLQLHPLCLCNKNQVQSDGGISVNYDQFYGSRRIAVQDRKQLYQAQSKNINSNDLPEDSPYRLKVERSEGELSDSFDFSNIPRSSSLSHQF